MSYEFTKLGAVEALTEMPENANTLVEVDGAIKRVPASALGGSSTPAPVVILPETEIAAITESPITTAPNAMPEVGAVCTVTYNGTAYDCPAVAAITAEVTGVAFGNTDALGIPGGNTNAPFMVVLLETPMDMEGVPVYGTLIPMEEFAEGTYVTLSIVEAAKTESAGGVGITLVKVSGESSDMQTFTNVTCDKKFADLKSVYDADGLLWCRLTLIIDQGDAKLEMVAECPLSGYDKTAEPPYFMFNPIGTLSASGIAVQLDSEDNCTIFID